MSRSGALKALAIGEAIADKLPMMPARIKAFPLAGRALVGGVASALASSAGRGGHLTQDWGRKLGAGVLGASAAVVSSHLFYRARRFASARGFAVGFIAGWVEDAFVTWAGGRLTRELARVPVKD